MTFEELERKIEKGIPNLHYACNSLLSGMDTDNLKSFQSKLSALDSGVGTLEFIGGVFDGSDILQNILLIENDVDVLFRRCEVWPMALHENIIEHISGTGIYCHLNVTNFSNLQEQFPTVKRGEKVYLSAAEFRKSYLESKDTLLADKIFDIPKCLEDLGDMVGKASHVRMFRGQQPIDVIHYIPCEDSKMFPKYSFSCGDCIISSEFGLIPKCREHGDPKIEWQISFTHLENKIIRETWSQNDHAAYTLFKCIIKTHIAIPKYLKSYHLKLCMFLTQQQNPGVSHFNVCQRLLILLDFLLYSVTKGDLPQPFIHQRLNYFERIPKETLKILEGKIFDFRKNIKTKPDDLGLYKGIPSAESLQKELIYLLCISTVTEIEKDIMKYKFIELKELFLDQETYLFMFESYLFKSFDKLGLKNHPLLGHKDHTIIHEALNDWNFLSKRYELMLCNLRLSLFNAEFFGFNEKETSLEEKIDKLCPIWRTFCSNKLYYQVCNNNTVFEMRHIPVEDTCKDDIVSSQVICLCTVDNTYGSTFHLFQHKTDFIDSGSERNRTNLLPIKYIRAEQTLVFNLWATRQIYLHNKKLFSKLRSTVTDFEIQVCKSVIQSIFLCATGGFYKL